MRKFIIGVIAAATSLTAVTAANAGYWAWNGYTYVYVQVCETIWNGFSWVNVCG